MSTVLESPWSMIEVRAAGAVAEWKAFGTVVRVAVADPDSTDTARHAVDSVLHRSALVVGRGKPDSELTRLNSTGAGGAFLLARGLRELLEVALGAARWTGGLVDPARPHERLGSAGAGEHEATSDEQRARCPVAGSGCSVRLSGALLELEPGVELDLGATALPFAADRAARLAWARSGSQVLVSFDGDIALTPDGREDPWPIALEGAPSCTTDTAQVVLLHRGGLATATSPPSRNGHASSSSRASTIALRHERRRTAMVAAASCVEAKVAAMAAVAACSHGREWLEATGLPARLVDTDGSLSYFGGWPETDGAALPLVSSWHIDRAQP